MPTERSPYPSVLAILFVLLSVLDLAFTMLLGEDCEANPIAYLVWHVGGDPLLYAAKGFAISAILMIAAAATETGRDWGGRLISLGIGAEIVAVFSLIYFWWHMPRMVL